VEVESHPDPSIRSDVESPAEESPAGEEPRDILLRRDACLSLLERFAALENRILDRLDCLNENRELSGLLHARERELVQKDTEIEKLRRDLVYQTRLLEKEFEERLRSYQDKMAALEKQFQERVELERRHFDERLAMEQRFWSDKLDQEKETFDRKLAEAKRRESFWQRLVKMMTWS